MLNILFIRKKNNSVHRVVITSPLKWSVLAGLCFALVLAFGLGSWFTQKSIDQYEQSLVDLHANQFEIEQNQLQTRAKIESQLDTLMSEVAMQKARLVRLDALGDRVTDIAKLDRG